MIKTKVAKPTTESLIQRVNISKVSGGEPHYKTYSVNFNESIFTIRKRNNLIWAESDIVEQHGDDVFNYIGCYIDDNSI